MTSRVLTLISVFIFFLQGVSDCSFATPRKIVLAKSGKAMLALVIPVNPSETELFAAQELSRYLQKITDASFAIQRGCNKSRSSVWLQVNDCLQKEQYTISIRGRNLLLSGGSNRAILYAVYDLLHRLGCRWYAPAFAFYRGYSEFIPSRSFLAYSASTDVNERPQFVYRKLDIEEGRSHTAENLKLIIEWMPKVRLNTFMVPLDYQGAGRVKWDNWRTELTSELKIRDLMIEVGGHGYQNFLNAQMENGDLFRQHPEWFGKNKDGKPDPAQNLVFNTSNTGAVQWLTKNFSTYVQSHPEIDIFDFWPPDVAKWAESSDLNALGEPSDRQARLVNAIDSIAKTINPKLRIEIIAYGQVLLPPPNIQLHPDVLVDICPINQSFETDLFDSANLNNQLYAKAVYQWSQRYPGDLGLYSYYRKYAWHSLPVLIPHLIQIEQKKYASLRFKAISTYAEPADWFTYELNHYILAVLTWKPNASVDNLIQEFCRNRYGSNSNLALDVYSALEKLVPHYCSIPFTTAKAKSQTSAALSKLMMLQKRITQAITEQKDSTVLHNLGKLSMMLHYAIADIDLRQDANGHSKDIKSKTGQLVNFLEQRSYEGVFLTGKNDLISLFKHYGLK